MRVSGLSGYLFYVSAFNCVYKFTPKPTNYTQGRPKAYPVTQIAYQKSLEDKNADTRGGTVYVFLFHFCFYLCFFVEDNCITSIKQLNDYFWLN